MKGNLKIFEISSTLPTIFNAKHTNKIFQMVRVIEKRVIRVRLKRDALLKIIRSLKQNSKTYG